MYRSILRWAVLLVTIQWTAGPDALALQNDLANKILEHRRQGVMIDTRPSKSWTLRRRMASISVISRILRRDDGRHVGMQPAVAITLVELGLSLE